MYKKKLFGLTVFLSALILLSVLSFSVIAKDKKESTQSKNTTMATNEGASYTTIAGDQGKASDDKKLQNEIDKIDIEAQMKISELKLKSVSEQAAPGNEKEIKKLTTEIGTLEGKLLQNKMEKSLLDKEDSNKKDDDKKGWGKGGNPDKKGYGMGGNPDKKGYGKGGNTEKNGKEDDDDNNGEDPTPTQDRPMMTPQGKATPSPQGNTGTQPMPGMQHNSSMNTEGTPPKTEDSKMPVK